MGEADRRGGYAVLHVDPAEGAHADVRDHASGIMQVVGIMSESICPEVLGVEVRGLVLEMVGDYLRGGVFSGKGKPEFRHERAADLRRELAEGLLHVREVSVRFHYRRPDFLLDRQNVGKSGHLEDLHDDLVYMRDLHASLSVHRFLRRKQYTETCG